MQELENQLDKLKAQLKHLTELQEKEKQAVDSQNIDHFVNQMNQMYSSIGAPPSSLSAQENANQNVRPLQTTVQNFNFINIEGQSKEIQDKMQEADKLVAKVKEMQLKLDECEQEKADKAQKIQCLK